MWEAYERILLNHYILFRNTIITLFYSDLYFLNLNNIGETLGGITK
jgi:hypothetical protein